MSPKSSGQGCGAQFKRGFTLIEILVVCAVLALLASILFPVFGRVKEAGRRSTCASNLKQIGLAAEMYASDNRGHYPNAPSCSWPDRLLPYVRQTSIFECPSALNSPYVPGCRPPAPSGGDNHDEFGAAVIYQGSYNLCLYNKKSFPTSASFGHPSSTISVLDGSGDWIIPGIKNLSSPEIWLRSGIRKPRHGGGSNALFLDGHVKWMRYDALQDRSLWNLGDPPPIED